MCVCILNYNGDVPFKDYSLGNSLCFLSLPSKDFIVFLLEKLQCCCWSVLECYEILLTKFIDCTLKYMYVMQHRSSNTMRGLQFLHLYMCVCVCVCVCLNEYETYKTRRYDLHIAFTLCPVSFSSLENLTWEHHLEERFLIFHIAFYKLLRI